MSSADASLLLLVWGAVRKMTQSTYRLLAMTAPARPLSESSRQDPLPGRQDPPPGLTRLASIGPLLSPKGDAPKPNGDTPSSKRMRIGGPAPSGKCALKLANVDGRARARLLRHRLGTGYALLSGPRAYIPNRKAGYPDAGWDHRMGRNGRKAGLRRDRRTLGSFDWDP